MAKCDICGKGVSFGIQLSHSHRRTNRPFKPNVQKVKAVVDGTPCRVHACTRCLRSGKVTRAAREIKLPAATETGLQEVAVETFVASEVANDEVITVDAPVEEDAVAESVDVPVSEDEVTEDASL